MRNLLFDLDGTLLDLDLDQFLQHYFGLLSRQFRDCLEPDAFVSHLLASTRAMVENLDPERTNEDVFMEHFLPGIPLPREELMARIDQFYREKFPELAYLAAKKPLARQLVQLALDQGREVVLATNPVFPRLAIEHRMAWAGLDDLPFRLVTTYEEMHFCKPHREYFQEILARVGWKPEGSAMVGNDVEEDLAAAPLGLSTYLVTDQARWGNGPEAWVHVQGSLEKLARILEEGRL